METREDYGRMLRYFWEEKGDIERYSSFSVERTQQEFPAVAEAWRQYKTAIALMDAVVRDAGN